MEECLPWTEQSIWKENKKHEGKGQFGTKECAVHMAECFVTLPW